MLHSALILFVSFALASTTLRASSISAGEGSVEEFHVLNSTISGSMKGDFAGVILTSRSSDPQSILVCGDLFSDISSGKQSRSNKIKSDEADAPNGDVAAIWEIGPSQDHDEMPIGALAGMGLLPGIAPESVQPNATPDGETSMAIEESLELNPKVLTGSLCCFTLMALAWVTRARYILP